MNAFVHLRMSNESPEMKEQVVIAENTSNSLVYRLPQSSLSSRCMPGVSNEYAGWVQLKNAFHPKNSFGELPAAQPRLVLHANENYSSGQDFPNLTFMHLARGDCRRTCCGEGTGDGIDLMLSKLKDYSKMFFQGVGMTMEDKKKAPTFASQLLRESVPC